MSHKINIYYVLNFITTCQPSCQLQIILEIIIGPQKFNIAEIIHFHMSVFSNDVTLKGTLHVSVYPFI